MVATFPRVPAGHGSVILLFLLLLCMVLLAVGMGLFVFTRAVEMKYREMGAFLVYFRPFWASFMTTNVTTAFLMK